MQEQNAATRDIAGNVQQAADATGQVSIQIAGVTEAVVTTGASANGVLGASDHVAEEARTLRSEVDVFVEKLRAA